MVPDDLLARRVSLLRGGGHGRPTARDEAPRPQVATQFGGASATERAPERGAESALTLVSAPAGFGKTTLLAEWLAVAAADERSVAWLSLDQRDNDPALFWTYLVAALKTGAPGGRCRCALAPAVGPSRRSKRALSPCLTTSTLVSNDVVLVLDDYHVIEARDVQDGMAFLLEHLPPQMHLVIASRADPALPLARLRGRGELVEIRAADLRFTPDEAAAYLNEVMGLELTAADVAALEGRTEGWIAALQLAALSMQGRDDVAAFIAGFAGDDRYIVDYLVDEVLQRQPEHVRHFLLQTSILDRLSGPLCDAVTGQDGGKAMLEALERENLFLVPLDDRRRWYRYHQLFADVLHAHLLDEQPDDVPDLHRRASEWYEQNGEPSEAIRHALAAEDFERAADLVELAIPAMRRSRQEAAVRGWLERAARRGGPGQAGAQRRVRRSVAGQRRVRGRRGPAAGRRALAGRGDGYPSDPMPQRRRWSSSTTTEFRRLPAEIELYRAALALVRGDVPGTVRHARRALDLSPADDHLGRASAAALLGLASWASGDLEAGHRAYAECMAGLQRAGHVADTFGCAIALADIRRTQGRLGDAMRTYEQALQRASEQGGPVLRGTADMYVGMSEVHRERDDLPAATQQLLRSQELGEHTGLPQNPYRWRVAMARIREAEGDLDGALDLLDEAERLYVGDFFPDVRPVPAVRARVWVTQGELGEALGWARERGLSAADDLSYLREFEHITLARVLLARYADERAEHHSIEDATRLLERLLRAAEEGQQDRKRHRDPGAAGARPPGARRHPRCARIAGTRADAGRAGGLRPDLRRRGPADGLPAQGGRETPDRPKLCPPAPGRR